MSFDFASYNVLATAYIRQEFYPHTAPEVLAAKHRIPALCRYVAAFGADVCCLQEVERSVFDALDAELSPPGYEGHLTMKSGFRPDGCAVYFRREKFRLVQATNLAYDEGLDAAPSGHIAQMLVLEGDGGRLGVANTHLKWDPPSTPAERQYGLAQIRELLRVIQQPLSGGLPWIVCGDFNARPSSRTVQLVREAGFDFLHSNNLRAATCNANGRAKMIDYVFFPSSLAATAAPLVSVVDATPLPSATQPSDHIPVIGRFEWSLPAGSGARRDTGGAA